jgi:lipopolysaccharide biosynthesis glycosyltransferase
MINIFIGYDPRESIAYHVCANSIIRHASTPVAITPLALHTLQNYKEHHTDGSNQFIYSRFLVPYLMNFNRWAIFIDGDMIVKDDITKLWNLRDESKDVMVVKHNYQTKSSIKYLNAKNENYPRKNWSSVILWNCSSADNAVLSPTFVQTSSGKALHRFSWLYDRNIGDLPIEWNWLPDEFGVNDDAKLLHYTLGTPSFFEYANSPMAGDWHKEKLYMEYCLQLTGKL